MKNRKTGAIIGIFILLYLSLAGQYINDNPDASNVIFLYGLIDTIIITFIMMIIPLIFRLINKNKLETNFGKKVCKWNSIGCSYYLLYYQ